MDKLPGRLEIAARIHQLLLRDLGQGIDIEQMLRKDRYARDVLLVCDAYKGGELATLSQQYRKAPPLEDAIGAGRAPQQTDWSRNTSGFGVSRPMSMDPLGPPPERRTGDARTASTRAETAAPVASATPSLKQRLVTRWWQR